MSKKEKTTPYILGGSAVGATLGASGGFKKLLSTWNDEKSFDVHLSKNKRLLPLYTLAGALLGATAGPGVKYLRKEAEKKTDRLSNLQIGAIGAAAGIGAGILFRKGFRKTPLQQASGGKLTRGVVLDTSYNKEILQPKTLINKIKKELSYGDVEFVNLKKKPKRVEGAYYHEADIDVKSPKADVSYNTNKKIISTLQNKEEFGKIKGKMVARATSLSKATKNKIFNTPQELVSALATTKQKYYYKPRADEASAGQGHFSTEHFQKMLQEETYYKKREPELKALFENQKEYIAQKYLDVAKIKQGPNAGMPASERRVHFSVKDNKVKILGTKYPRWLDYKDVQVKNISKPAATGIGAAVGISVATRKEKNKDIKHGVIGAAAGITLARGGVKLLEHGFAVPKVYMRPDKYELQKGLQELWSKNPKLRSKSHGVYGADILTDKTGKKWVVEINDQSAYTHKFPVAHQLYKHITGRDTRTMSAAKGILVGGTTAAGLKMVNKKERK